MDDIIISMSDFCEEHWSAFVQRCEERGITEEEAEEKFKLIKEKILE